MSYLYPLLLNSSLHETIWGGRRLARDQWKYLPSDMITVGESWETEISNSIKNGPYAGKTLGTLVDELGSSLLGAQSIAIFGPRFPLLAKFIDANAQLSVQVHPNDRYATEYEGGKLGKTEFWYILSADPGAKIIHGFKNSVSSADVLQAIQNATLEQLMHEESVQAGDIIFVPAGTVHAIGSGVLLYELQQYSDITYRMYDYARLNADGKPRELHIERSLDVTQYEQSRQIKMHPAQLISTPAYEERCLVACPYFISRELSFKQYGAIETTTKESCIILTSLGAEVKICYGAGLTRGEWLRRGQTMIVPAGLGLYRIEGTGTLLMSYVPASTDDAWQIWQANNVEGAAC